MTTIQKMLPNIFKTDPRPKENEKKHKATKKEIPDEGDSDSNTDQEAGRSEEEENKKGEEDSEDEEGGQKVTRHDKTEINPVPLRRTIHPATKSSLDFEEGKMQKDVYSVLSFGTF